MLYQCIKYTIEAETEIKKAEAAMLIGIKLFLPSFIVYTGKKSETNRLRTVQ